MTAELGQRVLIERPCINQESATGLLRAHACPTCFLASHLGPVLMKRRGESNAPNADSNGQRAGFDTQKLRDALRAVLPTYVDMADVGHEM